jgi:hypothetical protein
MADGYFVRFLREVNTNDYDVFIYNDSREENNKDPSSIWIDYDTRWLDYQYLAATHTVIGRGEQEVPDKNRTINCRAWLTFSDNFRFITHGELLMVEQKQRVINLNVGAESRNRSILLALSGTAGTQINRCTDMMVCPHKIASYIKHWNLGNVFCQENAVGIASYHFIQPPDVGTSSTNTTAENTHAFISYEHDYVTECAPLDNGRPVTSRVQFRNISCHEYGYKNTIRHERV